MSEEVLQEQVTTEGEGTPEPAPEPQSTTPAANETLAANETPPEPSAPPPPPQDFPDNWRELLAGTNKTAMKTLERIQSPSDLFKAYRELRSERDSGKVIKRPTTDSTDEDKAAFRKALGEPDEPTGYIESLDLSNGRVLGDSDTPIAEVFAQRLHGKGVTPEAFSTMVDTYLDIEQQKSDTQIEVDAEYKAESMASLRQELGGEFAQMPRYINALFQENSDFKDVLLTARDKDGAILGNNPLVIKALYALGKELYPTAPMHGGGADAVQSIDEEIKGLESRMRDRKAWAKDEAGQSRYRELIDMKNKIQRRTAA